MFGLIISIENMFSYYAIVLLLGLSIALERPSVTTKLGIINGYHKTSYDGRTYSSFEGIPFAKPPVGKLRFEAPVEPNPWETPLEADKIYMCSQIHCFLKRPIGSEDCLYLNVYVPKDVPNPKDNMNVIVHIHGSGFMKGSSSLAGPLFFMDRDVIYVNLNYRVGALGFLSTEDDVVPGNNGLKDQAFALQWIQNNIKEFGGNPNSVTITGASAGGASVHFHYLSKLSKGLFHRGISQSGTALAPWALQEGALERTKRLAVLVGCEDTTTTRLLTECLKEKSSDEIVKQTENLKSPAGEFPIAIFAPVVEKETTSAFLVDYPYELLNRGDFNDLPWIVSMCTDEGNIGVLRLFKEFELLNEKFDKFAHYYLDYNYTTCDVDKEVVAQKIRKQYFGTEKIGKDTYRGIMKLFGDRMFGFDLEKSARIQAKMAKSKVYSYVYGYKSSFSDMLHKIMGLSDLELGVGHVEDAQLLYDIRMTAGIGAFNSDPSETDKIIKDMMIDMYISFANYNEPIFNGLTVDAVSNAKDFTYLSIKSTTDVKMNVTDELTPTKFWEGLPIIENEKFPRKSCKENEVKIEL